MDKIVQVSNPVTGVAAGFDATCDLPIGPRYHALILAITATGKAATVLTLADVLGLIRVMINGKAQRTILATELDAIQTKYGADFGVLAFNSTGAGNTLAPVYNGGAVQGPQAASQTTFILRINFSEPWRKSYTAREARALPTAWVNGSSLKSFQLILSCPNTGNFAANPGYSIQVHAVTDNLLGSLDGNKNPVTLMSKWYRNGIPYNAAGDLPVVNLIKTAPGVLAVHEETTFFCQAGDDISRIVETADSRQIRDVVKVMNDILLLDNGYNPALNTGNADRFDLDHDYSDLPTDGLVLSSSAGQITNHRMVLTLTAAAAGNKIINAISQVYEPLINGIT